MEYSKSINMLAAVLGCEARVVTRYNRPAEVEFELGGQQGQTMNSRHVKFVVADYGMNQFKDDDSDEISFHLRISQATYTDGAPVTIGRAIELMLSEEPDTLRDLTIDAMLRESGLGEKYAPAVNSIFQTIKEMTGHEPMIVGTKKNALNEPAVGFFVMDGDVLLVGQVRE
jgi:hypothetical protein